MVLATPMVRPPIQIEGGLILSFKKQPINEADPGGHHLHIPIAAVIFLDGVSLLLAACGAVKSGTQT